MTQDSDPEIAAFAKKCLQKVDRPLNCNSKG